jgi:hypothetical protein
MHGWMEAAYSTRLKTVTLLPTGENRWVPSGLKSRLPWQYTVPSKLENLKSVFMVGRGPLPSPPVL